MPTRGADNAGAAFAALIESRSAGRENLPAVTFYDGGSRGPALTWGDLKAAAGKPPSELPSQIGCSWVERLVAGLASADPVVVGRAPAGDRRLTSEKPSSTLFVPTSGTTGAPKLVPNVTIRGAALVPVRARLAHRVRLDEARGVLLRADSVRHASGLTFLFDALTLGVSVHLVAGSAAQRFFDRLEEGEVDWMYTHPWDLAALAREDKRRHRDLETLRTLVHMGGPCDSEIKRFWQTRIGAQNVFEVYGSSEGYGVTVARGDEWEARPGTVGRPLFHSLETRREGGSRCAPGEIGDVFMLDRHGRARSVGDRGCVDSDGYLYLEARVGDRVSVAGNTVSIQAVESALAAIDGVVDSAVVAAVDSLVGTRLEGLFVGTIGVQELRRRLGETLESFAIPRRLRRVSEIPRGPGGKLLRDRLLTGG